MSLTSGVWVFVWLPKFLITTFIKFGFSLVILSIFLPWLYSLFYFPICFHLSRVIKGFILNLFRVLEHVIISMFKLLSYASVILNLSGPTIVGLLSSVVVILSCVSIIVFLFCCLVIWSCDDARCWFLALSLLGGHNHSWCLLPSQS